MHHLRAIKVTVAREAMTFEGTKARGRREKVPSFFRNTVTIKRSCTQGGKHDCADGANVRLSTLNRLALRLQGCTPF